MGVEGWGGGRRKGHREQGEGVRTVPHGNAVLCPQAEGNLNIVMEFASRGSVEQAIQRRQATRCFFAELTVLGWLQQLGGALQHMHSKQILHRDLKVHAA